MAPLLDDVVEQLDDANPNPDPMTSSAMGALGPDGDDPQGAPMASVILEAERAFLEERAAAGHLPSALQLYRYQYGIDETEPLELADVRGWLTALCGSVDSARVVMEAAIERNDNVLFGTALAEVWALRKPTVGDAPPDRSSKGKMIIDLIDWAQSQANYYP